MKQKTLLILIVLLIVALVGLANYLYQQRSHQLQQMQLDQQASQKQIADLNDRLVAVARQQQGRDVGSNIAQPNFTLQASQAEHQQLNQQRNDLRLLQRQWSLTALQLANDYLKQANYQKSEQILLQVQQNIIESQHSISDPFNNTLIQTLKIDQLNISQEAIRQQQQRNSLDQALMQLQQQLNLMSVQPPSALLNQSANGDKNSVLSTAWFKHLFLLEPANPTTAQHMLDRRFVCKQASINIAMARLAVSNNSQMRFNSNINEAMVQLNLLTDPNARQIAQQLNKLKNLKLPLNVELTSLTLLSGKKSTS